MGFGKVAEGKISHSACANAYIDVPIINIIRLLKKMVKAYVSITKPLPKSYPIISLLRISS